jgi:PAS domain S-box-containing protein
MKDKKNNVCAEWMSQMLEDTKDNFFVYNLEGVCLYTNNNLINTLGFDPVGKSLHEIFPHRSERHIEKILSDYQKIRETKKWDFIPIQKEKINTWEERVFTVTRNPITWHWKPAISGIGKDITELFLAIEEVAKV